MKHIIIYYIYIYMGISIVMRVPKVDGLIMEIPTKMDDLGVAPVQETAI